MNTDRFIFAENLVTVMRRSGVSPKELCEKASLNEAMLRKYISGRNMPTAPMLKRISKALGVTMEILMQGIGDD